MNISTSDSQSGHRTTRRHRRPSTAILAGRWPVRRLTFRYLAMLNWLSQQACDWLPHQNMIRRSTATSYWLTS